MRSILSLSLSLPVRADPVGVHDKFLLLASDGIWDVMSDGDAQELCLQHAQHTPEEIANHVLTLALARGTRDNLSCLIVKLK